MSSRQNSFSKASARMPSILLALLVISSYTLFSPKSSQQIIPYASAQLFSSHSTTGKQNRKASLNDVSNLNYNPSSSTSDEQYSNNLLNDQYGNSADSRVTSSRRGILFNNNNDNVATPVGYNTNRFPTIPFTPGAKRWSMNRRYRQRSLRSYGSRSYTQMMKNAANKNNLLRFQDIANKLLAANIVTFACQVLNPAITQYGAKISHLVLSGQQLHRLITPMFLHGSIGHLAMNSYSLNNIGPHVESLFGSKRFLATYIASGITGNLLSAVMSPNPSVGASGAIFGCIGAYYVFLKRNQVRFYFNTNLCVCVSIHIAFSDFTFFFIGVLWVLWRVRASKHTTNIITQYCIWLF